MTLSALELLLPGFLASFARAAAFLYAAPLTGSVHVPPKFRAAIAIAIAFLVAPARPPVEIGALVGVIAAEAMLGLAVGLAARIVIAAAEAGGQMMALSSGLGMANTFDPTLGDIASPLRRLAFTLAGLAFITTGGLELCIRAVAIAPPPSSATLAELARHVIDRAADVFELGLRFAAPLMVAGLVANIGVALASKAAPALNIFSVMLALLLLAGGVTMFATAPAFVAELRATARLAADAATAGILP